MKNAVSKKTETLLRKVQQKILNEPRQFVMHAFFTDTMDSIPNCGTAACIAGWTLAFKLKKNPFVTRCKVLAKEIDEHEEARKALGITQQQANDLFYDDRWPDPFKYQWADTTGRQKVRRAKIAVSRIEHFITTGE